QGVAGSAAPAQAYAAEAERWATVKSKLTPISPLLYDPRYDKDADPNFPNRFDSERAVSNDVASLRQAAASESAEKWGSKADRYVAIITLLAVSLFLLGMSLTIGGRVRLLFVAPAAFVAVWCL